MASPAAPFKAAVEAALRGSAALAAAMGGTVRLYTEVPANAPLPYVVIGDDEIEEISDDCGAEHSILSTLQWWAQKVGAAKGSDVVRAMGAAIVEAVLTELAIAGHDTVLAVMENPETYGTDPDQSSRGRVSIRYETTAQES